MLHLGHAPAIDMYNVYCQQRSNLNIFPLLKNADGSPVLLSGDLNAHHPLFEPWSGGSVNQGGQHITQMLEGLPVVMLHSKPCPTHIAGGSLDLTITVNGDSQDVQVTPVPELLSDHWAQESLLHISKQSGTTPTTKQRLDTWKANWKTFKEFLSTWYANYNVPESV